MSFINSIQSMLPRPENRSREEIARDLEDEFNFHLEMKAHALMGQTPGLERDEAKVVARRLFGDVEAIKGQCQRIALKERSMLQRVNFVMMLVVMLLVIGVGAQVMITQRYNTLALQAITSDLANMKFETAAAARSDGNNAQATAGVVYVKGAVARRGVYSLPEIGVLTISRLITAAGGLEGQADGARVNIKRRDGEAWRSFNYNLDDVGIGDFVMQNDDEITVTLQFPTTSVDTGVPARSLLVGKWVEINAQAEPLHDGASLELIAIDDVRNLKGVPIGILTLPQSTEQYRVSFMDGEAANLQIERVSDQVHLKPGRWDARTGSLNLNIARAVERTDIPLRFVFEGANRADEKDARAAAVGEFVVRLFALADPADPNLDQTIRDFLDAEEKAVDAKYPDDPAIAGMIKELIAARRKIFDADAGFRAAATAEAREQAVTNFLTTVLISDDPGPADVSVQQVIDQASERVEQMAAENPELAATMRAQLAAMKAQTAQAPAEQASDNADAPVKADDGAAARVLVEGDIDTVGWHAINMDRGTLLSDFLRGLGVKDLHWVTYRRNGTTGGGSPRLGRDYLDASAERVILRPNDELMVQDEIDIRERRNYFRQIWRTTGGGVTTWASQPEADGRRWLVEIDSTRGGTGRLVREDADESWRLAFQTEGASLVGPSIARRSTTKIVDWDVRVADSRLVFDFATMRDDPRTRSIDPDSDSSPPMPDIAGVIEFARAGDDTLFQKHARQAERAVTIQRIALELFSMGNFNDSKLQEGVEEYLQDAIKRLENDYRDDAETATLIRDTIAAPLQAFMIDPRASESTDAESRREAFNDFLTQLLLAAKPEGSEMTAIQSLERVNDLVDGAFSRTGDPNIAVRVRLAIEQAKRQAMGEKSPLPPMTDGDLAKFVQQLMTASIPNSAASKLPTLDELNRGAAAIDVIYAKDPTLLSKLRDMVATVRKRLETGAADAPATQPSAGSGGDSQQG